MPRTIRGQDMRQLRIFSRVLDRWAETNIRCARAWEGVEEVPWWYNERALLSVLAAAVWQERGIAFEEFRTEKRSRLKKARRGLYPGRQDLYIRLRGKEFIAEAKRCWSGATRSGPNVATSIDNRLDAACRDIQKTPSGGRKRLGLVFAIPYVRAHQRKSAAERIKRWLERVREVNYSCCAWVFPGRGRYAGNRPRIFPGIALFIREA